MARRLEETGIVPVRSYMIIVIPDDSAPFSMWSPSLDSVTAFVREMDPRTLECHCAGHDYGEDADELIAHCRAGRRTH